MTRQSRQNFLIPLEKVRCKLMPLSRLLELTQGEEIDVKQTYKKAETNGFSVYVFM